MSDLAFVVAAFVCLVSACAIVSQKNPVYSVVCMLPFFIGMAVLFVLLQAPFMAAMLMLVYGGAILVLFLFVIMLINLRPEELKDDLTLLSYGSAAILGGLLGGFLLSLVKEGVPAESELARQFSQPIGPISAEELREGVVQKGAAVFGSAESLSVPLFQQYVVPFELVSILIVVAILGAVMLAKKKT